MSGPLSGKSEVVCDLISFRDNCGLLNAFEARWALTLLDHAMKVLRQEYVSRGKELVFNTLKAYARIGESSPEASYEKRFLACHHW